MRPELPSPADLRAKIENSLTRSWYEKDGWSRRLRPLSKVYQTIAKSMVPDKRDVYLPPIPTLVVGNIVVGGAGKTPLVISLCELLKDNGWRPAILSRGYHGEVDDFPHMVVDTDSAKAVGDEAVLMHRRLAVPVCIDPQRTRGARYLVGHRLCNVIVCDDGLQHHKLARDIELAVVDGQRLLGNGLCLPAGPLREPASRLSDVDYVVMNGEPRDDSIKHDVIMYLRPSEFINLRSGEAFRPAEFVARVKGRTLRTVAGIGNPERFHATLTQMGLQCQHSVFADHHDFTASDIDFSDESVLIMTEKDAVKCAVFAGDEHWYLSVRGELPSSFEQNVLDAVLEAQKSRQAVT